LLVGRLRRIEWRVARRRQQRRLGRHRGRCLLAGLIVLVGAISERAGNRHAAIGQRTAGNLAALLGAEQKTGNAAGDGTAAEAAEEAACLLQQVAAAGAAKLAERPAGLLALIALVGIALIQPADELVQQALGVEHRVIPRLLRGTT